VAYPWDGVCRARSRRAGRYPHGVSDPQTSPEPPAQPESTSPDRMRVAAALVCAAEGLTLVGFCAFYLWELAHGASSDATRAAMSALLIALFGIALGVLARAWLRGADWPNTPTVVWNALLLPVAWSLVQSGHGPLGALVAVVAATGIVAAIRARTSGFASPDPGADA
jgi:hypothetical protein